MRPERMAARSPWCLAALAALLLAGCTDTLVYSERTGFNLGIFITDEPSTPVKLNAGLERNVITFAPPTGGYQVGEGGARKTIENDAVSMLSGFRLNDDHGSPLNPFDGTLNIRTQFASGAAAVILAGDPAAAAKITGARVDYCRDDDSVRIHDWIRNDNTGANRAALKQWLADNGVDVKFPTTFINGCGFEAKRKKAVDDLNI